MTVSLRQYCCDSIVVRASLRLDLFRSLSNVLVAHVRFSGGLSVGHGTSLHRGSSNLCPDMCVYIYVSVYPFCGTPRVRLFIVAVVIVHIFYCTIVVHY